MSYAAPPHGNTRGEECSFSADEAIKGVMGTPEDCNVNTVGSAPGINSYLTSRTTVLCESRD